MQADFNDVGPLAQALDQPVAGRLGLTASLSGDAVAPRLSAVVNGNFRDLALDEPTLMKLLGTAPTIKGTFVATDTTVEIGALEIAGADGTLTADGSASLDGTSLALNLAVAVAEIAPLTASLAGAVGGRLAGKLHVTRAQPDPQLHFAGTADLAALHAPDPTAALLGPTVHASAEGALDGGSVTLRMAQIEGAATRLTASGNIGDALDLQYRLEFPRLAALAPLARIDLAGSATIAGDLAGPMRSPALAGTISGDGVRVGGMAIELVEGNVEVADLGARPQGRLGLDLVAQAQRLSVATEYRLREDGGVALTDLRLTAPQTSAVGEMAVLPAGLLQGRIRGDSGDLAALQAFFGQAVAGMATVDVTLTPVGQAQSIDAVLDVRNLAFSPAGAGPASAARVTLNAGLKDAFGVPDGHVELRVDSARTGDLILANAMLVADGVARNLELQLQAAGDWGRPIAIDGAANLAFDEAGQRIRVDRLQGSLGTLPAKLNRPATLRRDSGGIALADLDAMIGAGRLTGGGRIGSEQIDLRLALADAPLDVIGTFAPKADVGGIASAELRLVGSTAAPTAHADIRIRDLRVGATKIGAVLGVDSTATVDIGNGRGDITAQLGNGPELALTGRLSIPVSLTVQPFSFRLADDAPVSGRLGGTADLALLPRIIDLRGDQLGGRLNVDMSIGGTVAVPRLAGDLQVSDGSYASARTGTTLRDVTAALAGDNDRLVLRSLTASDGGAGRLSASGAATLGFTDKARYEGELTLLQFTLRKGSDITTASGHLAGQLDLTPPAADGTRRFAATADADEPVVDGRSVALLGSHMRATAEGSMGAAGMAIEFGAARGNRGPADRERNDRRRPGSRLPPGIVAACGALAGRRPRPRRQRDGRGQGHGATGVTDDRRRILRARAACRVSGYRNGRGEIQRAQSRPPPARRPCARSRCRRPAPSLSTAYRRRDDGVVALSDLKLTAPQTALAGDVSPAQRPAGRSHPRQDRRPCAGRRRDRPFDDGSGYARSVRRVGQCETGDRGRHRRPQPVARGRRWHVVGRRATDAEGAARRRLRVARWHGRTACYAGNGPPTCRDAARFRGGAATPGRCGWRLTAGGTRGHPFAVDAGGILGLRADEQRLQLDRFDGSFGPLKARLNKPATVSRDARGFALSGLDASLGDGHLTGAGSTRTNQVDLRLSLVDLPLGVVTAFLPRADVGGKATAELRLAGTPQKPTAHADIQLTDLSVAGTKISEPTGGVRGTVNLDVRDGRAALQARLGGSRDLTIDGQATAPIAFRLQPFALDLAPGAAMSGTLKGAIDLGLVPRIVDLHGDALGGRLDMDMTLAGTLAAPRFAGDARLAGGSYASADAGTVLREVNAVIAGDDARIRLQSLTAGDGGKGRLSASGTVTLRAPSRARYEGELNLEHFTILNRSDAMAVASGRLQLSDEARGARLGGEVTVESAELRVPEKLPPKVVKLDVVEVNAPPERVQSVRKKEEAGIGLPVALGLAVKIPGHAFLRGRGIDFGNGAASCGSTERWRRRISPASFEVVRGRVDLVGKPFEVETGKVVFVGGGAIDPELDFTASGEAEDLTVSVHVTGVASAPKFELATNSGLPPEEALSRLLFGQNAGSLSRGEAVQLAQAAAALSGGGPGVLDKLRRTFGLDVLRVGASSGSAEDASVTAGKYISDKVFLKVEQGVTPESRNVGVEVRVLPRVRVEGGVGAGGDGKVGVNWRYDY